MYTVIICAAFFLIFLFGAIVTYEEYDISLTFIISIIFAILFGIVIVVQGICIASADASAKVDIAQFESVRKTITEQRANSHTELERVEMTKIIIEKNTWLAQQKANYENPWESWFYSKSYLTVEPLK